MAFYHKVEVYICAGRLNDKDYGYLLNAYRNWLVTNAHLEVYVHRQKCSISLL